jgi:hypothetical protein
MVHLAMGAGNHIVGWSAGECASQQLPGLGEVSPLSPGVETSPELFRGLGAGERA